MADSKTLFPNLVALAEQGRKERSLASAIINGRRDLVEELIKVSMESPFLGIGVGSTAAVRRGVMFPQQSIGATTKINPKAVETFEKIAKMQRGTPEIAMLQVQKTAGGGVISPVVEHVGDLTHRMTNDVRFGNLNRDLVLQKTETALRVLKNPYGFIRELSENIKNNAKSRNQNPAQLMKDVDAALKKYAEEHKKIPVYNRAQFLARESAVAIGEKKFDKAVRLLEQLNELAKDRTRFHNAATAVRTGRNGQPEPLP